MGHTSGGPSTTENFVGLWYGTPSPMVRDDKGDFLSIICNCI